MKTESAGRIGLVVAIGLAGIAGGLAGWWLRGPAVSTPASDGAPVEPQTASALTTSTAPDSAGLSVAARPADPRPDPDHVNQVVANLFSADTSDLRTLLDSIGALTRMSDAEVKIAWAELAQRPPISEFGSSLAVFLLWSRMSSMGEDVAIPPGWGAENFEPAIRLEEARKNLPDILKRLNAGEDLTDAERRAVFTDAMRKDPIEAVRLWCRTTRPEDYQYAARYFADALSNPRTRAAIVAEVRKWQSGEDLARVTSALAQTWIARDPAGVEAWLKEPEQEPVRDALMWEVANMRVLTDPVLAWDWSRSLPEASRRHALGMSAAQLANQDPENGARLIAQLTDPGERTAAVQEYARTLAANDITQWEQWRGTLPDNERDLANASAFPLWAYNDIEKAVEWLNTQPAGEMKSRLVAALVNIYAGRDPMNAAKWIQTIADPDQRRDAARAALMIIGTDDLDAIRTILGAVEN